MTLILALLLLLPTAGWAGEQRPLCQQVSPIDPWYLETVPCNVPPISTEPITSEPGCLATMESAMREHDAIHLIEEEKERAWVTIADGSAILDWPADNMSYNVYTPDKRTEEQRLDDEAQAVQKRIVALKERRERDHKEAEEREAKRLRKNAFVQQWAEAKRECWGQP